MNLSGRNNTRYERFRRNHKRAVDKGGNKKVNKTAIKLAASILIFLTALTIKLVFPEFTNSVRDRVLSVMNDNIDYKSAVAALSDGLSGRTDFKDAVTETIAYLTGKEEALPVSSDDIPEEKVKIDADENGDNTGNDQDKVNITQPDNVTYNESKEEMVAAFVESKREFQSYELPANTTYQMPDINLQYVSPADGVVTSQFGYRVHPVDNAVKFHYGLDFGCDDGSDVRSFADGEVTSVTDSTSYGLNVTVTHGNGVETKYAHCSDILVSVGDKVKLGDIIAKSGHTGNATGPCMHFELRVNGVYVNPEYYLSLI